MYKKTCLWFAVISLIALSVPSYARVGGAGMGAGNRGSAAGVGAPGAPAAGKPGYGAGGAGAPGVPAAGRPGYGAGGNCQCSCRLDG
jgi:hypothetical protein